MNEREGAKPHDHDAVTHVHGGWLHEHRIQLNSEQLAQAVLVAAREGGRRPASDRFEWYGSADEMAEGILAALAAEPDAQARIVEWAEDPNVRKMLMEDADIAAKQEHDS